MMGLVVVLKGVMFSKSLGNTGLEAGKKMSRMLGVPPSAVGPMLRYIQQQHVKL